MRHETPFLGTPPPPLHYVDQAPRRLRWRRLKQTNHILHGRTQGTGGEERLGQTHSTRDYSTNALLSQKEKHKPCCDSVLYSHILKRATSCGTEA